MGSCFGPNGQGRHADALQSDCATGMCHDLFGGARERRADALGYSRCTFCVNEFVGRRAEPQSLTFDLWRNCMMCQQFHDVANDFGSAPAPLDRRAEPLQTIPQCDWADACFFTRGRHADALQSD
eukprot:gene11742-35345_t